MFSVGMVPQRALLRRCGLGRSAGAFFSRQAVASDEVRDVVAKVLADAEKDALRRYVAAYALWYQAADGGQDTVVNALKPLAKGGPPMAQLTSEILIGLIRTPSDGAAFLAVLVP